jgi:hypothetical protein
MARPNHLPCVNTAEGIRRINENQRLYDKNPERYERQERERREQLEREREEQAEGQTYGDWYNDR